MGLLFFSTMPLYVALFWAVVLLLDKRQTNLPKRFLAFFFLISAINYFVHTLYFNHQYELYAVFDSVWNMTSLLGYPLYYYYIRLLTSDIKISWRYLWITFPAIAVALFSATLYLLMSPSEIDFFIRGVMYGEPEYVKEVYPLLVRLQQIKLVLFNVVFLIQVLLSLYFGLGLIVKYNHRIKDFYSNGYGKNLTSIKWLLIVFVFASTVSMLSTIVGKSFFIAHEWLLAIPSFTHSLFLFAIGYVGFQQNFTIRDFCHDIDFSDQLKEKNQEKHSELSFNHEAQKKQLISLLEQETVYLNPDLCIIDLAVKLNTNRTYVSRMINENFQTTFSDLINKYRANHAKTLLSSGDASLLSMKEIGEQSGFSCQSSFYRVFKKEIGVSPGNFRKK